MKPIDSTDFITPFKLLEHVTRNLPWNVAIHEIRQKWLDEQIRFWVRWLPEEFYGPKPGAVQRHYDEPAPPEFLLNMENRGIAFARVASDEDGILFRARQDGLSVRVARRCGKILALG